MSIAVVTAVVALAALGLALIRFRRIKADPDGPRTLMPGMKG